MKIAGVFVGAPSRARLIAARMPLPLRTLQLCLLLAATLADAETLIPISADQAAKLDIRTAKPQAADAVPLLSASARVVVPPGREFMVSAPQAGLLSRIDVAVGDNVSQNQVLAQLASPAFLALQRDVLHAANGHKLADTLLERDKKLYSDGAIAKRRWEETRTLHDKSSASDNEIRQVLAITGMSIGEIERLVKTQKLSGRLDLKSPVSGMVLERLATTGQQVDPLASLFRVADVSKLWLEIDLPPEQVNNVAAGDLVRVTNLSGADLRSLRPTLTQPSPQGRGLGEGIEQDVSARVIGIGRQVLPSTHSVLARAALDNGTDKLYPGQTVGVDILRSSAATNNGPPYREWRVPASALARHANGSYVFVRKPQGFEPLAVESLDQSNADLILRGPLTPEDDVAVQGVAAIKAKWVEE